MRISLAKSGSRGPRADQGVRPTISAGFAALAKSMWHQAILPAGDRVEKPPRGVGSELGDRQDWQRISGKMRRKSMPVLSVPGALVDGDEVTMAVFQELSRAEGPSQQTTKGAPSVPPSSVMPPECRTLT